MNDIAALAGSPLVLKLAPVAALVFLCVFYLWRAGSMNTLFERVWSLAAGQAKVASKELEEFLAWNRDIEKFRFMYRLKVESQAQLKRLMTWCKKYDIPVVRLQRARYWVRLREAEIVVEPSRRELACTVVVMAAAVLCMVWANMGANDPLAQLYMKESGARFRTDGAVIHFRGSNGETFDLARCDDQATRESVTSMPQADLALLCEADTRAQLPAFAEKSVREQRWLYGILIAVSLLFLIACFRYFLGWCEAKDIRNILDKHGEERDNTYS
ncbi:DUF6216 family protein [Thauera sp. Sel9]|uniref:DUF6216 family protein n=1 Tax=Thauera sp. Sel9 TaxID=2974299 RepID=UPI0021E18889|nr:DUF6216 family protein [Thauera sp. Sel9]MCV2217661.1 DUF6216 family protein [Thauera sp. Sel9]